MHASLRVVLRRAAGVVAALAALVGLAFGAMTLNITLAARSGVARVDGTVSGLALHHAVTIVRDDRDVPHVRARDEHDLFFAQGYVTGSDRLFQMDVTRRYVLGTLAELLGPPLLRIDEAQRTLDARTMAEREYADLSPVAKARLEAYADGVNAAARREPTPPEYRMLFAEFAPWRPQDALVAGTATVVDLTDSWDDVVARARIMHDLPSAAVAKALFPLTDARYGVSTVGRVPVAVATLPPLPARRIGRHDDTRATVAWNDESRDGHGSNEWVAGGALTATGRALLANDPHLTRGVPGVWHLVDLEAPGFHAAGATFAGVPGVILGHNDRIAWGSTNGTVASPRVYAEHFTDDTHYRSGNAVAPARERTETFHVRFGADVRVAYASTRHGFVLERSGTIRHAVQWAAFERPRSPLDAFDDLDRAQTLAAAERALATYPGPTQNFVLAADDGRAAYHLAGLVPDDPLWGLDAYDGTTTPPTPLAFVPFAALPERPPARDVLAVSSNNIQYGRGYPYRLTPNFTPPYRAAEITRRLHARTAYTVADFAAIQNDDMSLPDREFAGDLRAALRARHLTASPRYRAAYAALAAYTGVVRSTSRGATVAVRTRVAALRAFATRILGTADGAAYLTLGPAYTVLLQALRERPTGWIPDRDAFLIAALDTATADAGGPEQLTTTYGAAFAVVPRHPLAPFGVSWWNAPALPGRSGGFAPAVQGATLGQSFRAVWDVGNWDAGGITIPVGESGEPGSPHYTDLAGAWQRRELAPLPWSANAVARATRTTETLTP
jgi:penicillin amidase